MQPEPDGELWAAILELASRLGADAVVRVSRTIEPCESPATATAVSAGTATTSSAWLSERAQFTGARALECIQLVADAVVLETANYSCKQTQTCWSERRDANLIEPARGRLNPTLFAPAVVPRDQEQQPPAAK